MNLFKRIIEKVRHLFLKKIKPEMIGYKNGSRISNMSHISNRNGNLSIGKNVFVGHFNYIDAFNANVHIGDSVQISNFISILTHSSHDSIRNEHLIDDFRQEIHHINPVHIGKFTYIGPHSIIMPGSIIGDHCVVAAYTLVKGDFPDYSIIKGNPGVVVGSTKDRDQKIEGSFKSKH